MKALKILKAMLNYYHISVYEGQKIKEAIAELEQLKADYDKINDAWVDCVERYESTINKQIIQENKTCDNCKHHNITDIGRSCEKWWHCSVCKPNKWESK